LTFIPAWTKSMGMKLKSWLIPACLIVVWAVVGSGCVAAIGNRDAQSRSNTTLGQQLMDLKKAQEAGAISPTEYEQQRARLLDPK
jgi:uncharacterized Ntn-hydrolase superfamily protein